MDLLKLKTYTLVYEYRFMKKLNKKNKTMRKRGKKQETIIFDIDKLDEVNNELIINEDIPSNKIKCPCNSCILKSSYAKHLLSKKHQIYLKNIDTNSDTNSESDSDNDDNINENILEKEPLINILEKEPLINILEKEPLINILEKEPTAVIHENKPFYKPIELQKNLNFPVVEINNCLSSFNKNNKSRTLNIEFYKNIYFNDKDKIIRMITNLYNNNNNFQALFNSYNLLKIVKNLHEDKFLGLHFNGNFYNKTNKSNQLHFYVQNNEITTITEVNYLI
jgi:hypothetical protein